MYYVYRVPFYKGLCLWEGGVMIQGAVVLYFVQQVSLGNTFCAFRLIDVTGVENWLINHAAYKMLAFSPSGRKKDWGLVLAGRAVWWTC